jgi:hypothetical protein
LKGEGNKNLIKFLRDRNVTVEVGWFEGNKYPPESGETEGPPVAYIASIQEYGDRSKRIPARPFMRPTIRKRQKYWFNLLLKLSRNCLVGGRSLFNAYEGLSLQAEADFRRAITKVYEPELSDKTIKKRLKRYKKKVITKTLMKPLVDTRRMLQTLTRAFPLQ